MAVQNKMITAPITAGADLSARQYRVLQVDGTLATENADAIGVLENKPSASGQPATVAIMGVMKGIAGAAVSAGARLKVQSGGWLITATSGTGNVGKCSATAASSGDVFTFFGNFVNAADVQQA